MLIIVILQKKMYFGECAHAAAHVNKRNGECLILLCQQSFGRMFQ